MKAKRILSAFLAIAVVLTTLASLSTVAFALDPVNADTEAMVTITVEPIADDEFDTEYMPKPDPSEGIAYWIMVNFTGFGKIYTAKTTNETGRKIMSVGIQLEPADGGKMSDYMLTTKSDDSLYNTNMDEEDKAFLTISYPYDTSLLFNFAATSTAACFPTTKNKTYNDELSLMMMPVIVKKDVTLKAKMPMAFTIKEFSSGSATSWVEHASDRPGTLKWTESITLKGPEAVAPTGYTVTYKDEDGTELGTATEQTTFNASGAAAPTKDDEEYYTYEFAGWSTTQGATAVNITGGTALTKDTTVYAVYTKTKINPAGVVTGDMGVTLSKEPVQGYTNVISFTKTFTDGLKGAKSFGVLFIPTEILKGAELKEDTDTAVKIELANEYLGKGSVEVKAALINVPTDYMNKSFTTRFFVKDVDGEVSYSNPTASN